MKNELVKKFTNVFSNYIENGYIPNYFMKARLVLISKDNTKFPTIDKTWPINILPAITKLFEPSLLNKIYKLTESRNFNRNQKGFIKGWSTDNNIEDLLNFGPKHQKELYSAKSKSAYVFFDLKNAYDLIPRNILLLKMQEFWIDNNIILITQKMLEGFSLKYRSVKIKTQRGLTQGSTFSPILLKIFLNDLSNELEINGTYTLAYADDIAC